jgi:hypothetical protein
LTCDSLAVRRVSPAVGGVLRDARAASVTAAMHG